MRLVEAKTCQNISEFAAELEAIVEKEGPVTGRFNETEWPIEVGQGAVEIEDDWFDAHSQRLIDKYEQDRMTVRQAVEKAFGPVPEDATLHLHITFSSRLVLYKEDGDFWFWASNIKCWVPSSREAADIDISDRPGSALLGFFGPEFDAVVNPPKSAEPKPPKVVADAFSDEATEQPPSTAMDSDAEELGF